MPLLVGIDDTDSLQGMCTTYVAAELVSRVESLDLIGRPRLVRLNPNIPWKTRGNGALCLAFGEGRGTPFEVGADGGEPLEAYPRSAPAARSRSLERMALETVMELADLRDGEAQPGLVVSRVRPEASLYTMAVREVVPWRAVEPYLEAADFYAAPRGRRGLVGALAALAWRPSDRTYEVLAYRAREAWGSPRRVRREDVRALDARFPTTFNNYDEENDYMATVPHSPCPVLLGIRGEDPGALPQALVSLDAEPAARWLVFETNQATDDHLVARPIARLRPHTSASVEGEVAAPPRDLPGGHVVFPLVGGGTIDCVAYEPTKGFRRVVRQLRSGDRVRVHGSVREKPRALNLEKIEILHLEPAQEKVANPSCPSCGRRMKSAGKGAGFRCRPCGARAPQESARHARVRRSIREIAYEPPVVARRHLSKPLRRGGP